MNAIAQTNFDPHRVRQDREHRRRVDFKASAARWNAHVADTQIVDLSYHGCKLIAPAGVREGERIQLRVVRLGVIQAEVRWMRDGYAGCRLLTV